MPERRAALIGFGLAGSVFHAPLIEAAPGLRLATIVTANGERAARARESHPDAEVVDSPERVWERAGDHGLVVIATPNDSHAPLASRALELGLPVVVDKPLAPTAAGARELVAQAEGLGVPLTVFQNRRWDSDQLTLRRLLDEGALGEVHRFESRFERWRPELSGGSWREETPPERGGGLLLDLGAHLVDQALTLFGPAEEVYGEVLSRRGGAADDDDFIAITHGSGVESHLWASSVAADLGPRLRVLGSEAAFVVGGLDGQEEALATGRRPGEDEPWGVVPEERWGRLVRGEDSEAVRPEPGDWPRFYRELAVALDAGESPPVDPRDALAVLQVLELARA